MPVEIFLMRNSLLFILLLAPTIAGADEPFVLKDKQRIVFLGDSNTYAGKFIAYLDAYLCTRFPDKRFELINLGLPSETVTGLSEADHPYPRPNIHQRVDRALELAKPDVVVICYGMNDGIYSPFDEERFKKYQSDLQALVAKVEKTGAAAMLMSPAPFDATSLKGKVLPKDAPKFSWLRPYERYDEEVLTKYSNWLLTWRDKKYTVIDAHAALLKHLETMRKGDPAYRISGDGIHPNANGHLVIALEILKAWNAPRAVKDIVFDVAKDPPTEQSDVKINVPARNRISFSFTSPHPMPADPAWTARAKEIEKFDERVNRYALKVENMKGILALRIGDLKADGRRVSITADQLAKGTDLAEMLKVLPDPQAPAIWKLIDQKNRILGPAWLTHVGHKRPDTPKGMPMAQALAKAADLDAEIRKLCAPVEVSIAIGPLGK
jgi:lysophospholipase L1-like esterase